MSSGVGAAFELHRARDPARNADGVKAAFLTAVPAAGVLETLADRDLLPPLVRFRVRREERLELEVFHRGVVEYDLARVHQLQNADRGDRLRDAGNAKQRRWLDRDFLLDIGISEPARVNELAVPRNSDRRAGYGVLLQELGEQIVERREVRVRRAGNGRVIGRDGE